MAQRLLGVLSLVLVLWAPWARAGSVLLGWDMPPPPPVRQFRIYRVSGACPPSTVLPHAQLSIFAVDSQETRAENGAASNAVDGNTATFWHSAYSPQVAPLPHMLVLDLGRLYQVDGLHYLPRQDGSLNGTIVQYAIALTTDGHFWPAPVATGTWPADTSEKRVVFAPMVARYVSLTALASINGGPWASAAEVRISAAPLVVPPATPVGTVEGTLRRYTDTTVPAGSTNCWYVTAVGHDGTESPQSNAVDLRAPGIAAPMNVRLVPQ